MLFEEIGVVDVDQEMRVVAVYVSRGPGCCRS